MDVIESLTAESPDLAAAYDNMGQLYEKKLWHQLSISLDEFVGQASNNRGGSFRRLYSDFITKFDARLNQVRLALIISTIGRSFSDPADALELYQTALKARARLGAEASICLEMDVVLVSIRLGQLDQAKELLEGAKSALSGLSSSETVVFSKFYKATAEYRKVCGNVFSPMPYFARRHNLTHTSTTTATTTTAPWSTSGVLQGCPHVPCLHSCGRASSGGKVRSCDGHGSGVGDGGEHFQLWRGHCNANSRCAERLS
jgi:hypothetical protein